MDNFVPDEQEIRMKAPFFEDASSSLGVVGHSTTMSITKLQSKIKQAMADLGGVVTGFQSGKFNERYAFRISFLYKGVAGKIDVAALPIRKETEARVRQAKCQALYSVWKRLESQYNSLLVMPGDHPLVPYMIDNKGRTLMQAIAEEQRFPELPEPDEDVVDGDFTEA